MGIGCISNPPIMMQVSNGFIWHKQCLADTLNIGCIDILDFQIAGTCQNRY